MNVNEDTGRILWSQESKYYLVRLVKENLVIISPDVSAETMAKKELAWKAIEENFAADGMQCQLGKLKRLWKRMKDTARQNITKFNEQKRRGIKSLKPPTDLDIIVAELLAARNLAKRKPKIEPRRAEQRGGTTSRPQVVQPKREPSESLDEEYFQNDFAIKVGQQHSQQQQQHPQSANDLLEPMTILEEYDSNGYSNCDDDMDEDDDEDVNIECVPDVKLNHHRPSAATRTPSKSNTTATSSKIVPVAGQTSLSEVELKLKQAQLRNEVERMNLEREVYRKKLILLDLQIKQANLDILARKNN